MSTITRDAVEWEQRAPGEVHYSARWPDGHLLVHANPECSHVKVDAVILSPKIVDTLWEKNCAGPDHTQNEHDVMWCENCACRKDVGPLVRE